VDLDTGRPITTFKGRRVKEFAKNYNTDNT
jgi:hypothetical protein